MTPANGIAAAALAGSQRSMVDSIVYKFNQAVSLTPTGAFTITPDAIQVSGAASPTPVTGPDRELHQPRTAVSPGSSRSAATA